VVILATAAGASTVAVYFRGPADDASNVKPLESRVWPEPLVELHDALQRQCKLDIQRDTVLRRCEAQEATVAQRIAGRLCLLQAAARFRDLNGTWPDASRFLRIHYPDASYELILCRQIIHRIEMELGSLPSSRVVGVVAQLEAELAEHLRQHGKVCL